MPQEILKYCSFHTYIKLVFSIILVALADFLFYAHSASSIVALFAILLIFAIAFTNYNKKKSLYRNLILGVSIICAISMIEMPSLLNILMFLVFTSLYAIWPFLKSTNILLLKVFYGFLYYFGLWFRLPKDYKIFSKINSKNKLNINFKSLLSYILLPIIMGSVFIYLFYWANPIVSNWLEGFNLLYLFENISFSRIIFLSFMALLIWGLMRPKFFLKNNKKSVKPQSEIKAPNYLFNNKSIFISLLTFNIIFLVENILDIAFLWSGAELPDGLTHAQYAHAGAYPLILTALLAGGFILLVFNIQNEEPKKIIFNLVYLWIIQNIFLVFSSILRTIKYIETYSLTYLRIAALIWMGLVALGLLFIIIRIAFKKSDLWLININTISTVLVLLVSCFINYGSIIAWYNIGHSKYFNLNGTNLDIYYLREIGTEALPAIIYLENILVKNNVQTNLNEIKELRYKLSQEIISKNKNWRSFNYRNYRMAKELGL